jgi:hypothetical protein
MKHCKVILLFLVLIPVLGLAQQKAKKHNDVPAVFQNAHYVYVEAVDGDELKPGLYPEDRQAIYDVEDGLRDWNRYVLTTRREGADFVLVVRKGRIASAQTRAGVSAPSRLPPSAGPVSGRAPGQSGDPDGIGTTAEVGPENDILRVYQVADGKLTGPLWSREIQDGLDAPSVVLLRQLRTAVERAYPSQPPPSKPNP